MSEYISEYLLVESTVTGWFRLSSGGRGRKREPGGKGVAGGKGEVVASGLALKGSAVVAAAVVVK